MQKQGTVGIIVIILLCLIGCTKNNQAANIAKLQKEAQLKYNDPNISDFEKRFIPQYQEEKPEPVQEAKLPVFRPRTSKSAHKDVSVIPGLRALTAYQTSYTAERPAVPALPSITAPANAIADSGKLTITDWGPKEKIPDIIEHPSFYVVFSLPVKALAMLPEPQASSDFLSISPAVKGIFRWYGSRYLAFEAEESLIPGQEYTITVQDGVKSLGGKQLEGQRQFKTSSEALRITDFRLGPTFTKQLKHWIYIDKDDVIPEAANEALLTFNYPVQIDKLASSMYAEVREPDKQPVRHTCTLTQEAPNRILARIEGGIPYNAGVSIKVPQATGKTIAATYHTLRNFRLKSAESGHSYGDYKNPAQLVFSHQIQQTSVLGNIITDPPMPITENNIAVNGERIMLHGLPVNSKDTYTVTVLKGLTDIYGRNLSESKPQRITVPEPSGFVRFLDNGRRMLEARYPHKLLFEYRNILPTSAYSVVKTDNPLYVPWDINVIQAAKQTLKIGERNKNQFKIVDLDPYLDNGKGFVRFNASVTFSDNSPWRDAEYATETNCTTVQVTDLGITVRSAMNKTIVLVTSLATGKPVEGAAVYLYNGDTYGDTIITPQQGAQHAFVSGMTGKDGSVILTYDSRSIAFFKEAANSFAVFVEKDGDRAVFYPTTHSPWQSGIHATASMAEAAQQQQRTFFFSDRGLYKPGEKILLWGIDRNQYLGSFSPYTGAYTITLQEYTWDNPQVIETIQGACSESGGFWGSFDLPSAIKPGDYTLKYRRDDGADQREQEIFITVAYFEKLQFQAAVSFPQTQVISGQTVNGTVTASYLAGGGLANASYSGGWVRQGAEFKSDDPAAKQYRFGPYSTDYAMEQLGSFTGKLSADGSAQIACTTAAEGVVGSPYRYFAEASITNIGNQEIAARDSILVHPASFYVGIKRPDNLNGFAKTGDALAFPFILASPDGTPLTSASSVNGALSVELIRENWRIVQQHGSQGSVYANYEKELISEYTANLKAAAQGSVSVTPKNAGYYLLAISGTDKNGRKVKTEYSFYVTGSNAVFWNRDFESSLRLTPDRSLYNPGDTARILLESPLPAGTYLITVEREGIFTEEIRHIEGNTHVLEIPIAANYLPVVYVAVSSYSVRTGEPKHKYGEPDLDKPKGLFGATALLVNPRVKAFSIDIAASKTTYKPGEKAVFTLTAQKGGKPLQNAELTLLAVDRSVLDLINYHVPHPIEFFYDPEHFPLCVRGGDSRAWLMDPVSYETKNLYGGDSGEDKGDERSNFNPTAAFIPVLKTDANGKVTAEFTLPDSLTAYRITVVGVQGELLALHEEEITVQNTVNVLPVKPRRLRERDTSECGVLLSNLDTKAHSLTVSAAVRAPQSGIPVKGEAFIDGADTHTVKVEGGQQAVVYFDLAAKQAGEIELVFSIASDILTEKLVQPLTIERPFVFETVTATGSIEKNQTVASEGFSIPSLADSNTGALSITLDSSRLGLLASAVQYVFDYPYYCMEQQSSRMLPLIVFEKYIDVFGLDNRLADVRETVRNTFTDWANVQLAEGGFPYWPEGSYSSFYTSLRVAHVCAAAKRHGYSEKEIAVNTALLTSYLNRELQRNTKTLSAYLQAYSCYVLSLYGVSVPDAVISDLAGKSGNHAVQALIGLTYLNRNGSGDRSKAEACAQNIKRYLRPTAQGVDFDFTEPARPHFWFANDISLDFALVLQFLVQLHPQDEMVTHILHTLMQRQKAGYWQNTSVTAQVMSAFEALITYRNLDATDMTAAAAIGGQALVSGTFKGAGAKPVRAAAPFNNPPLNTMQRDTLLPLSLTKQGKGQLYYTARLSYALPQELQTMRDEGIGVAYSIRDTASGNVLTPASKGSPVITLESGRVYEADIRLASGKDYQFVALRVPVPSGAEILDAAFVTTAALQDTEDEEYKEEDTFRYLSSRRIYDNEVQYFWDEWPQGSSAIRFKFRAARRGVFPCPPATAECMYEPEIFGRSSGTLFVIQ
ncbi:MAG: alpha-2-macroglobulin family protein [Treponema sp.]